MRKQSGDYVVTIDQFNLIDPLKNDLLVVLKCIVAEKTNCFDDFFSYCSFIPIKKCKQR